MDDTIGLDYFESLPPDLRAALQQLRRDLRVVGLDIEGGRRRAGGLPEMRIQLAAKWPDRYGDEVISADAFQRIVLLADVWVGVEEIVRERAARTAEHPDGKWSLQQLRAALAESKPGIYGRMTVDQIAAMCRAEGIPVQTIRIGDKTHKGIRYADVERLIQARKAGRQGVAGAVTTP